MVIDGNTAGTTIGVWVGIALIAIAGVGKIVQALTELKGQVLNLVRTQDAHETRLTKQDEQLTTVAAAIPTTSASVTTSAPVVIDQTGDRP